MRNDWDFSQCTAEEAEYCAVYEYARTSSVVREAFGKLKQRKEADPNFDFEMSKACFNSLGLPPSQYCYWSLLYFLQRDEFINAFPETSWLSISETAKQGFVSDFSTSGEDDVEHSAISFMPMDDENYEKQYTRMSKHRQLDHAQKAVDSLVLIQIDWRYTDEQILNHFKAWLLFFRPEEFSNVEERGKGAKVWRPKLNQLGAYRLLEQLSVSEAETLTVVSLPESEGTKPLYATDSSWSEAKTKAQDSLQELETKGWLGDITQMCGWVADNLSSELA